MAADGDDEDEEADVTSTITSDVTVAVCTSEPGCSVCALLSVVIAACSAIDLRLGATPDDNVLVTLVLLSSV